MVTPNCFKKSISEMKLRVVFKKIKNYTKLFSSLKDEGLRPTPLMVTPNRFKKSISEIKKRVVFKKD